MSAHALLFAMDPFTPRMTGVPPPMLAATAYCSGPVEVLRVPKDTLPTLTETFDKGASDVL